MLDVVRRVAVEVFMPFTVGGGVRTIEDVRNLLLAGADKVSINSAAVHTPESCGGGRALRQPGIVLAVDAKRVDPQPDEAGASPRWEVYVSGGRVATGLDVVDWCVRGVALGAGEILLTSMDSDGTLAGYDLELTRTIAGGGLRPGDCQQRRDAGALRRCADGREGRRCAGGLALPRSRAEHRRSQGLSGGARHRRAALTQMTENRRAITGPEVGPMPLTYDARGLIPAVLQDAATGEILMMAWMNEEALQLTLETREAHFWSRSRRTLWHKGATSGNVQRVTEIGLIATRMCCCSRWSRPVRRVTRRAASTDDSGLATCAWRCRSPKPPYRKRDAMDDVLDELFDVILDRKANPTPGSYGESCWTAGTRS